MSSSFTRQPSSYRDPSGFLFFKNGVLYRQINQAFQKNYDQFISSGLYRQLVEKNILIPHKEISENLTGTPDWYLTIEPEVLPFISYPYEWCFDMWKDAALLTLDAADKALEYGMMLKDASVYNTQFHNGKVVFIDTLSFESYEEKPWIAYRQFCEHFFAPLALMHYLGAGFQSLFLSFPDGIPLGVAQKMLPFKSRFNLGVYLHLHLHASVSAKKGNPQETPARFPVQKLKNLLRNLRDTISSFRVKNSKGIWSDYYDEASQRNDYLETKKTLVDEWLNKLSSGSAIDAGANEGTFSLMMAKKNIEVVSTDIDHHSINKLYNEVKNNKIVNLYPLIMDLSRPSPAIGVNNEERASFVDRVNKDLVLALAVIHHLCIGNNMMFDQARDLFVGMGKQLIIEFVPKEDEKIRLMLQQKRDVYDWYNEENFLASFSKLYKIMESRKIGGSGRTLYLMDTYATT